MSEQPDDWGVTSSGPEIRWSRVISNSALTADMLPAPRSGWDELVHFAGTFNGYRVQPNVTHAAAALDEARAHFDAQGAPPPAGLASLRALLFFTQRADHFGGGYDADGADLPLAQALVEEIRERVAARDKAQEGRSEPEADVVGEIEDRLMDAFDRLVAAYERWGGHRYHGWTSYEDPRNYFGPVIRSEGDCVLRFAMELEREWPEAVHTEFPVSKANFANYDPAAERRQRVDLAVTDLSRFVEDETSQERFRSLRHQVFIEAKWFTKGWRGGPFEMDAKKRVASVEADARKLANHLRLGRCAVAAVLVVDDEDYLYENSDTSEWPADVWRLVVGPQALREIS